MRVSFEILWLSHIEMFSFVSKNMNEKLIRLMQLTHFTEFEIVKSSFCFSLEEK